MGTNQRQIYINRGNNGLQNDSSSFFLEITAVNKARFIFITNVGSPKAAKVVLSSGSIAQNTWTHIAAVRNGNTITLYIDGTADGTADVTGDTMNAVIQTLKIGDYTTAGDLEFLGHIDDLRITKGKALYTANFTAPTSELTKVTN